MSQQYLSEIRIFAFGIVPRGWLPCNGQTLAINQYQALFALLGTTYGGNGTSTFKLPNLQGNVPMHAGTHAGNTYTWGQVGGESQVTLGTSNLPIHTHGYMGTSANAATNLPAGTLPGNNTTKPFYSNTAPNTAMSPSAIGAAGSSQPHSNMAPYLTLNFCIAITGIFPSRN